MYLKICTVILHLIVLCLLIYGVAHSLSKLEVGCHEYDMVSIWSDTENFYLKTLIKESMNDNKITHQEYSRIKSWQNEVDHRKYLDRLQKNLRD